MFRNMAHARAVIRAWADDFNETRPHSALGYQTPNLRPPIHNPHSLSSSPPTVCHKYCKLYY
jgi:hypothetical protein